MGAIAGTVSYTRFIVEQPPGALSHDAAEQAIEARRFEPLSPTSEENESCGWVAIEDPLDHETPITRDRFAFGAPVALTYREDKFSLPKPLVRREVKRRVADMEAAGEKVTKMRRKAVELAVVAEMKRKTIPKTRTVDLVWDTSRGELRIYGTGSIANERAGALFERTFGVRVREATIARLATRGRDEKAVEELRATPIFDDGIERGWAPSLLGPEFLTWLYFHLEAEGYEVTVDTEHHALDVPVRFAIGRKTVLRAFDASGSTVSLAGPGLDDSGELCQAIRRGALVHTLALEMAVGERVYRFSLVHDGTVRTLRLPDVFTAEPVTEGEEAPRARRPDAADMLALRSMLVDDAESVIDALLAAFAALRFGDWPAALASIRATVTDRLALRAPEPVDDGLARCECGKRFPADEARHDEDGLTICPECHEGMLNDPDCWTPLEDLYEHMSAEAVEAERQRREKVLAARGEAA